MLFFRGYLPRTFQPKALLIVLGLAKQNISKSFSAPASIEVHSTFYQKYLGGNILLYLNGDMAKPWKDQNSEETVIKEVMGTRFSRINFRKARKEVLASYPHSGKNNLSSNDHTELKDYLCKQTEAA